MTRRIKASRRGQDWSRPLPQPLAIGGDLMTMRTLADVRDLIQRHLPTAYRDRPHWQMVAKDLDAVTAAAPKLRKLQSRSSWPS